VQQSRLFHALIGESQFAPDIPVDSREELLERQCLLIRHTVRSRAAVD